MIKLYKKDGTLLRALLVDDKSYRLKEIMGENAVFLYYELPEFFEVPVGSYINFAGEYYFLRYPENFTKHHSRKWEYSLKLEAWQADAADVKYKFFAGTHKNFKLKFPLTMNPAGFLKLFVDNMNLAGGGWSVGEALSADEKTLLFDDESCQEALAKIAQAYNTEFEYEGKMVHLRKVERTASPSLPLSYGKNKGLKEGVGRINFDNTRQINRLYVVGSERNIDGEKYGNPTLLLPKSETITYSGVTYVTDAHGTYIERQGLTAARVEGSIDLTHIYPSRVGTVSEVITVDTEKHFYDIEDSSIAAALNYNDCIIPGNDMLLKFQSGALAGIEFKVDYNHEAKRFKLHPKQEHGLTYPTAPDLPKVGDKYAIFQVQLPDNYITTASAKMLNDAAKALWEGEQTTQRVTGVLDEVYAVKNWKEIGGKIQLGQVVSFTDTQFMPNATLLRIVSIKSYLNSPKTPALQFANKVENRTFAQMLSSFKAKADGNSYSEVLKNNDRLKDIFLFKNTPDTANSHITFKDGITANKAIADDVTIVSKLHSKQFNSGFLGEGFMLQKNKLGNWGLELDNLVVRKNMDVFRLTIQEIKSVGGQLLLSPANMRCTKVEELTNVYRCYFNNDGGEIPNLWEVGDQAICQQFSGKGQKRYWRLVTALGADYIDLSKTDTDGSGIPAKDDEIVQLGHRTDPSRQNAILISSYGTPKIEQFKGIDSYSTAGKLVTRISPEGNLFRAVDFSVETADANSYLRLTGNKMEIKANVSFLPSSPALEDVKNISNTDKLNALAEAKKLISKSEAESKTAWENYATAKANNASAAAVTAAKAYADAEDAKKEALIKAYADGKVTDLESRQLAVINAKATLAKTQAQAYADDKITEEEAKRIAADEAKLAEAEKKARELVDAVEVGGVNLLNNTHLDAVNYTTKTNAPLLIPNATIIDFEANKSYILSFSFKCDTSNAITAANYCYLLAADGKGNRNLGHGSAISNGEWQRVVIFFKFKENRKGRVAIGFDSRQSQVGGNTDFYIKEEQLEKSTKATDYKPSLADQKKEIDLAKQLGVDAQKAADAVKQSANSYTLFAKDKHFREHNWNEYIEDTDAQGGMALRTWRGWSSSLHWKKQLNFLKIGAKYRIYIRAKFKGVIGSHGVKFGWYGGKSGYYELKSKITTSYKTIDVGVFVVNWAVSLNPYMWFLNSNSFIPNDGSNESGLYIDWIRFVEADVEDIADKKIADAEAKIESLKNDLDPTKQQADYLAKALKQDSEVQGGLVLGSVIAARDDNGKITTYFSGNRSLNEAAYKAGVENFGTKDERHNIALNHEGTADLGVLRVEKEGDVRVYDLDTKEERFGIIKKNIQSLSELQSASVFNLCDTGNPVNLSNSEEKFIQDLSLFIPKVGGELDVEGKMSITVVWDTSSADNSDFVRSQISLELYRDGVSQGSIWSYADIAVSGKDSFAKNVNIKESITAEKGFYTVKVKASILHSSGYSEVLVSLSSPKLTWKLEAQNYRKINIGLNGLFATYPDKLLYFSEQKGLVVDGPTDMPGLLATGSSSQYGSVSNLWGAKASGNGSHKISQGKFRVYHNIGHSNYTISVMCHSVGVVATVGTKASTYFEFYMQKNGSYYDSGFDYVVYGRNF